MKKKYLKYLFLSIFFFSMASNSYAAVGVDFGGKFGLGMGWWRGSDYERGLDEVTGAFDFIVGPYCSLDLHKYVGMQFELLFSYIGNGDEIQGATRDWRNYAFQVPVMVKPKFPVGPGDIFILAGFDLLILMTDFTYTIEAGGVEVTTDVEVGRQFHFGISCGLGYDWKLGPGRLQFAIKITPFLTHYGGSFDKGYQNEFTFDFGYAYTFKTR